MEMLFSYRTEIKLKLERRKVGTWMLQAITGEWPNRDPEILEPE